MPSPNRDLGPCVVIWDPTGANIQLTRTHGGVRFKDEIRKAEIFEDQQGETPVDRVTKGRLCQLTVPLTRNTIAQLGVVINGAVPGVNNLKVSNVVGGTEFANAKPIIAKPIVDGVVSVATAEWLHIHRAYPITDLDQAYDNAEQRKVNVIFHGYPDDKTGQVNEMWRYGPAS